MAEVDTITVKDSADVEREVPTILSLENRVGEVQASPTANTVLDRLKALLTGIVLAAGDNNVGNVDLASAIPAGTAHIGQVKTPIQYVTVSMTTPTDAQDAGDVVAATQVVAACTQANDVNGILHSVCLIDTDDQKAALTLVFFDANTTLGTEDAAPDIDDTEALTVIGHVEIGAGEYKDLGGASIVTKTGINLPVHPASGTDDIYMAIMTAGTPTYASGVITVRLGFI